MCVDINNIKTEPGIPARIQRSGAVIQTTADASSSDSNYGERS